MSTVSIPKYISDSVALSALGYIYDVSGLTATDKPAPTGTTVLNITIPAGYTFVTGTFKFSALNDFSTTISGTVTTPVAGEISVSFANADLTANTTYFMTFDLA